MEVRHAQGTLANKLEFIERFCRDMNKTAVPQDIIGSLSNDDGDVNENGKKAIGLDRQRNNIARVSRFFVHFFPSLHDYVVKMPKFTYCGGRKHNTTALFFFY